MKNRWGLIALSMAAVALMVGCVYVPPYSPYYFDDPYSPSPWYRPPEPMVPRYAPDDPYGGRYRPDSRYYGRRYENRRYEGERDPLDGRAGDGRRQDVLPPSKMDPPDSRKTPATPVDPKDIPTATRGSKPGRVKVPFPPYNELDVSGMASGSLAKDPTTGKVFRIP